MELIHFPDTELPQSPECKYAHVKANEEKWKEGFVIINCSHPESEFTLCILNHQINGCPIDKKI